MSAKKKELWEEDMLMAVATAQGVLVAAARQILARDKYDGIRAVKWMEKHNAIYREIADEFRAACGGSDEAVVKAARLAGDPNPEDAAL